MDLSREQLREIDRRATAEYGIPSIMLMENAGRGCAELMMKLNPHREPVTIFCGPGNNGGDGFVMARHLHNRGWSVGVLAFGTNDSSPDAVVNGIIIGKMNLPTIDLGGWYVDALFGTGLNRAPSDRYAELIRRFERDKVLAIDLPSGLDCDTGDPLGACVKAVHTATFIAPKLGFRNPNAKHYTGEVHPIDIGVPRALINDYAGGSSTRV